MKLSARCVCQYVQVFRDDTEPTALRDVYLYKSKWTDYSVRVVHESLNL